MFLYLSHRRFAGKTDIKPRRCTFEVLEGRYCLTSYALAGASGSVWQTTTSWTPATGYPGSAAGDSASFQPAAGTEVDVQFVQSLSNKLSQVTAGGGRTAINLTAATTGTAISADSLSVGGSGDASLSSNTNTLQFEASDASDRPTLSFGTIQIGQASGTAGGLFLFRNVLATAGSGVVVGGQGNGGLTLGPGDVGPFGLDFGAHLTMSGNGNGPSLTIGQASGSSGSVLVDDDARLNANGPVLVGAGGLGILTIKPGGRVNAEGSVTFSQPGGFGHLTMYGVGSVPELFPGSEGPATLSVGQSLVLGAGGAGDASVSSDAVILSATGVIGDSGPTSPGYTVIFATGAKWEVSYPVPMGSTSPSNPTLTVKNGTLEIYAGAEVDAASALIATAPKSRDEGVGTVIVQPAFPGLTPPTPDGGTSKLITAFGLTLGTSAAKAGGAPVAVGQLTIGGPTEKGGTAFVKTGDESASAAIINGGSVATVVQNGLWSISGNLAVGDQYNTAALKISSNGSVTVRGDASVDGKSSVGSGDSVSLSGNASGYSWLNIQGNLTVADFAGNNPSINISGGATTDPTVLLVGKAAKIGVAAGSGPIVTISNGGELITSYNTTEPTTVGDSTASRAKVVVNDGGIWDIGNIQTQAPAPQSLYIGGSDDKSNTSSVAVFNTGAIYAKMVVVDTGTLEGNGRVYGKVRNVSGDIAPGFSGDFFMDQVLGRDEILRVNGDAQLGPDGNLEIDIGGAIAGKNYDQLLVNGSANVGGYVFVTFAGYVPKAGDYFDIVISTNPITGRFNNDVLGTKLPEGLSWLWDYSFPNTVRLRVVKAVGVNISPNPVEGVSFTAATAALSGIDPAKESSISVYVDYGDGTTSLIDNTSGTAEYGNITFDTEDGITTATVNGIHTYNTNGVPRDYAVFTTFSIDGIPIGTVASSADVVLPAVTSLTFDSTSTAAANYENTPDDSRLATFEYAGNVAPIAATVNWMDGTTTIAMIVAEPDISPGCLRRLRGRYAIYYTDTLRPTTV